MNHQTEFTVFTYTRAQAIADGVLLDVTPVAQEAGFTCPIALTAGLWAKYGTQTPGEDHGTVWDVLWMLRCAATGILPAKIEHHAEGQIVWYELSLTPKGKQKPELVTLKAIAEFGEDGKEIITILLPDED